MLIQTFISSTQNLNIKKPYIQKISIKVPKVSCFFTHLDSSNSAKKYLIDL